MVSGSTDSRRRCDVPRITVKATDSSGNVTTQTIDYTVTTPSPGQRAPLIGMSAPADLYDQRREQVEATGGRLQAERIFSQGMAVPIDRIRAAIEDGRHPIVSFKPGDWGNVVAGQSDATLRSIANSLKAAGGDVTVVFHHEPDQQSTPADQGEGGTAAEFAAMQHRIIDVMKPVASNLKFAVIMNGWWWTARQARLTDAQIEVWLPRNLRDRLDVIGADDYSPNGGEPAVIKTQNRVAWAKRVGGVKALGVGETNAFTAKDLTDEFNLVKSEPLFRNGWACVWNSTGGSYLPLTETGLLDDFQAILKAWPTS